MCIESNINSLKKSKHQLARHTIQYLFVCQLILIKKFSHFLITQDDVNKIYQPDQQLKIDQYKKINSLCDPETKKSYSPLITNIQQKYFFKQKQQEPYLFIIRYFITNIRFMIASIIVYRCQKNLKFQFEKYIFKKYSCYLLDIIFSNILKIINYQQSQKQYNLSHPLIFLQLMNKVNATIIPEYQEEFQDLNMNESVNRSSKYKKILLMVFICVVTGITIYLIEDISYTSSKLVQKYPNSINSQLELANNDQNKPNLLEKTLIESRSAQEKQKEVSANNPTEGNKNIQQTPDIAQNKQNNIKAGQQQMPEKIETPAQRRERKKKQQIQRKNEVKQRIYHLSNKFPVDAATKPLPLSQKERIWNKQNQKQAQIQKQSYNRAINYIQLGINHPDQTLVAGQKHYLSQKYHIQQEQQQLPLCIVIPSYNNTANNRYQFNLKTIFEQEYQNYHIVYIDDFSPDNTSEKVEKYMNDNSIPKQKYLIIRNEQNKRALYSLRLAAQKHCQPYELFIVIDGDDGLVGTQVFKLYNHIFQQNDIWFAYSNYITVAFGVIGPCRRVKPEIIDQGKYRDVTDAEIWQISQLKAFYTELFLQIPQQDLLYPNSKTYIKTDYDRAMVYPMLQLMRNSSRILYIPQILYIYNDQTQLSDGKIHREEQLEDLALLKSANRRNKLECLFRQSQKGSCLEARQHALSQKKNRASVYDKKPI